MNTLLFVSQIGAPEGALVTAYRMTGQNVYIYDISSHEILPKLGTEQAPTWVHNDFSGNSHLRKLYFENLVKVLEISSVFATGLTASAFALDVLPAYNVVPCLFRGDLNYSSRRTGLVSSFKSINSKASLVFVEDTIEMDRAVGHGSTLPLLRFPTHVVENQKILSKQNKRVALLYSASSDEKKLEAQLSSFERTSSNLGYESKRVNIDNMYSLKDIRMGRGFPGTMRYRIGDCSHVVIFGDSRNTSSVFFGLSADSENVFVEDSINSYLMYANQEFKNYGRGAALLSRFKSTLKAEAKSSRPIIAPDLSSDKLPAYILQRINHKYSPNYEEFMTSKESLVFDIFFSVAPVENRANGARPQRIRNTALSFQDDTNCLRLSPHIDVIGRRSQYVRELITDGYQPRYVYGENSTSPMASFESILRVTQLFATLKAHGAKIGWFVRDLHWLSEDAPLVRSDFLEMQSMIKRGLFELKEISRTSDIFFAPDESSISSFKDLLGKNNPEIEWLPLPPGTAFTNQITNDYDISGSAKLTLTYSGGIQGIYRMDTFIDSIVPLCLNESIYVDFVIRDEDAETLRELLQFHKLDSTDAIRILQTDFEDYQPRTPKSVGVIILDTDYAKMAFPYKTVSMLEKGMPILTCDDMAVGKFVEHEQIGRSVPRDISVIRTAIIELSTSDWEQFRVRDSQMANSWTQRIKFVRESLQANLITTELI